PLRAPTLPSIRRRRAERARSPSENSSEFASTEETGMAVDLASRQARLARNQALYRTVNEQLEALNKAFEESVGIGSEWICECADTECTTPISAHLYEYEAVRLNPRTFIVATGHVFPEVE